MSLPTLGHLRRARLFLKATAVVVTVAFLGLYLQPLALAARLPSTAAPAAKAPPTSEEKLSHALERIEDQLAQLETKLERRADAAAEKAGLKTLRQELDALDKQARDNFDAIERHLKDKKLPQVILDRHTEAVRTYRSEMAVLKSNLDSFEIAPDDTERKARAKKARDHLKLKNAKKARPQFDPNDMPNKSLRPDPNNKPKLKQSDFIRAGLYDNPTVKLAAHGSFRIDQLPGASDPAYLAATTEVTLTPAIQAKAAELEHHPVKIYNWVRNNVEWLPTWGATQDADVTLGSQRGNAMDIASLLIALYRASDIPARYVHGTIEVPEDKFRNWAGGFTSITAAADYAASGGIPVTTVTSGGNITKIRLEHIWVEAAIDFQPSRGAVNKSADNWVQLDPSYKQYEDLQGLDVVAISGIDPQALAQSFASSGTVNTQEGWVTGLNPTILQNAQTQAQAALETHITNNLPNATVGDVIGGRKIIASNTTVLPTGLSYRSVVLGARYGAIPSGLQHTMTFGFGTDPLGEPINPVTFPWPNLNNHKVTLSFKPATAADEQTLASLLPSVPITDPSQLPSSIPSYLIFVIPEIALDGQVVGQGNAMRLGEMLNFYYGIERVNGQGSHTYTYQVAAGSYLSVTVAGGSVSSTMLDNLNAKLIDTEMKIMSGDAGLISTLTREDVLGDLFQVGVLGYFGQYLAIARVASQPQRARHVLPSAYGTLGYEPQIQSLFGFPRAITPGGMAVNVRLQWVIHSFDGDSTKRKQLSLLTGMLSSVLEHDVLEQMFVTVQIPGEAISAVKALQIANAGGQRIYHLTPQNRVNTLPNIHHDGGTMAEIQAALSIGKEVITHTDAVSIPGWNGAGYIIFDPVNGDGSYKISGGLNGAELVIGVFWFLGMIVLFGPLFGLMGIAFAIFAFANFIIFAVHIKNLVKSDISPEALAEEVNKLAALIVLGTVGSLALTGLGLATLGIILDSLLTGWLLSIGWVLL